MARFPVVVHERNEIYLGVLRERSYQVVCADPVAAVRRVRQAMREKQHPHGDVRSLTTRAGTPAAITLSGSAFVTTDPAPTTVLAPTSDRTTAPAPIQLPRPTWIVRSAPA